MIAIKIQCPCGQRYAFDVEPVNGRLASSVACPVCGVDGTENANAVLNRSLPVPATSTPAAPAAMRLRTASSGAPATLMAQAPAAEPAVSAAAPAPAHRPARLPGQLDPEQAQHEARAKILWGDSVEDVTKFLMLHGFAVAEASSIAQELFKERAITIRRNGVRKVVVGLGLVCVPVVAGLAFLKMGVFPVKLFGFTVVVGLYGAYLVLKGTIMFLAPKSEPGDVSSQ